MLIRTQNRRNLIDMKGMSVRACKYANSDKYSVEAYSNVHHASCEILGIYSSNEKALMVLDMIQDAYTEGNEWLSAAGKIFVMPADEEVNV